MLAREIRARLDCDVHRIEAADPYPADYDETVERNVREQDADARPAIADPLRSIDAYDTILLASPIWNIRAPMIMTTFAERYDFAGKTVHPVTTYAMSGLGSTPEDYERECRARASAKASRSAASRHARPAPTSTRGCAEPVCAPSSPVDGHVVRPQRLVGGHQDRAFCPRLGDQHPIERVTVMRRELLDRDRVGHADRQFADPSSDQLEGQAVADLELAQGALDRDLPRHDRAQEDLVTRVFQQLARGITDLGGVVRPPQHDMGVEQELQRAPKASAMSSGSSSKSSAIRSS